eukprot:CAMPEP_0119471770 /NCGR_PEP_ID=MMETSP1344-20130328/4098_1 /TAXON_ID=236787 /ORGANISM="Florenciella parvula, Strain CCMP2471" /LENGTH=135 /DNA_ID=CAMNT_0007504601 /DNA_START=811 /DNA_END=1218 /DNA_ORIENTATION=-
MFTTVTADMKGQHGGQHRKPSPVRFNDLPPVPVVVVAQNPPGAAAGVAAGVGAVQSRLAAHAEAQSARTPQLAFDRQSEWKGCSRCCACFALYRDCWGIVQGLFGIIIQNTYSLEYFFADDGGAASPPCEMNTFG